MLASVFFTLIVAKRRSLSQFFPESLAKHWVVWELRALVLLSFSFQAALIFSGNRRKYRYQIRPRLVVWLSYQAADWIASFSLSLLSRGQDDNKKISEDPNYAIMAFWAPIFLLQLCTPDTITAYSLEDNELWLRQFLSVSGQFAVATYALIRSWDSKPVNYLAIPMLAAALIKFGEKIYVQYLASSDQFRDSMLPIPDPGPNYAKFMDAYSAKKAEGFNTTRGQLIEIPTAEPLLLTTSSEATETPDEKILQQGYSLFLSSRGFLLISSLASRTIEPVELSSTNTLPQWLLKLLKLNLDLSTIISTPRHGFAEIDVIITCLLLTGAVFLEIYQVVLFLNSDWMRVWLDKKQLNSYRIVRLGRQLMQVSFLQSLHIFPASKRWSDHVAQYNLLKFCLNENSTTRNKVRKWFHEKLEKYRYTNETVSSELKELVFRQLLDKSKSAKDIKECRGLCGCRGGEILEKEECSRLLEWIVGVEFDQSILLWHIATDLLYFHDLNKNSSSVENSKCKISKVLSDYMMYLLVMQPSMLPNGIGLIRFRDTSAEATEFLQEWKYIKDVGQACAELLLVNSSEVLPADVKGDRSKSVLFDACRLAKAVQSLETEKQWDSDKKWKIISQVWVEIMGYAACHCQGRYHAKQLIMGGELLTHVWLLMAHLGISEQFQISEGHGRVKMLVS